MTYLLALLLLAGCAASPAPFPPACPRACPVSAELPPLPTTGDVTLAECCTDASGATWSRCAWNAYGRCKPGKES